MVGPICNPFAELPTAVPEGPWSGNLGADKWRTGVPSPVVSPSSGLRRSAPLRSKAKKHSGAPDRHYLI